MEKRRPANPAEFFEEFHPPVFRFIAASGFPRGDVEDLVQETLVEAWKARERFRGDASMLTWILSIAKNRARMRVRSEERERARRALAAIETEWLPDDLLSARETVGLVRQALESLDPGHADLLVRRYFDGKSVREIAAERGEGEKTVESRLHRAREAIRERLKGGGMDDER